VRQAHILKDTLDVLAVIHLTCPDMNKMVERLQRRALRENRLDDANLDIIRHRLETYESETKPVLEFYGGNVVYDIDSSQKPIHVLRDLIDIIVKVGSQRA
jgi:adenylate kinase